MAKILVIGLNPAWQQVFALSGRVGAGVQRATAFHALASGKGINAAKILARLGHDVSLLQILAGESGRRVGAACAAWGLRGLDVGVPGETRVCVTLLGGGETTEVIAPFSVGDAGVSGRLLDRVPAGGGFDAILVCGAAPAGLPEDLHARLVERAAAPLVVWDSVSGLVPDILPYVTWLKVNAAEFVRLEPVLAGEGPSLFVTDGADAARLRVREPHHQAWTCVPPRVTDPLNPIGAGDTATGVFTDGVLRGLEARAAAGRALAAASASCRNVLPAEWDPAEAARFEAEIAWVPA